MATLIEALARRGIARPGEALVAYRGIQTITVLVQPDGWSAEELTAVREFTAARRYDLVWAPDVRDERGQSLQPAAGAGGLSSRQGAAGRAGSR